MKNPRIAHVAALLAVGTLALAACSSSSESGTTSPSASSGGGSECADGSLKAAGSSAQANAVSEWIIDFQSQCEGATIDYQPVGSGAGVEAFNSNQVAFAGSDSALKPDEATAATTRCGGGTPLNIPMVGGAIAIAYNLPGVDGLVLDPKVIGQIFDNKITKWSDPAIKALNPDATLPDASIAQFHRSDSSGTTDNFVKYLDANDAWFYETGKDWVAKGGQGSKGSDQVIASVDGTPNSIGYVEISYLEGTTAKAALVDNGGGPVEATTENAANTIASAEIVGTGDDLALKLDATTTDPTSYPIVLVTYEITCQTGLEGSDLALTSAFLNYTASDAAQNMLPDLGYVPITGDLLTKVRTSVESIS